MRDKGFVAVLIVALVAISGMIMLSLNPVLDLPSSPDSISDFVGLAYEGFSDPISNCVFNNNTNTVSLSDSAVYKYGYYSINGAPWQMFTLNGNILGGNWLTGAASKTLPSFGVGEHYVVVYSCTRINNVWDCHGNRWQIKVVNNEATPVPTCTLGTNTNCAYCGNVCAADYACDAGSCKPVQSGTTMNIFIIGDSTAAQYSSSRYPLTGWGMQLQQYFNSQNVVVVNNAVSGASSKSYSTSSAWTNTYNSMNQGDYLFIQFGHNDEHADAEGTSPYTTYQDYLQVYIDGARAKGVYPVLLTPVERNLWSGSVLTNSHGEYPAAMIALAQEQNVPLIDMTAKTRTLYTSLGQAVTTNALFMNFAAGVYPNYPTGSTDNSHYQVRGANETAKLVIDGIYGLGSSSTVYRLVPYIKSATKGTGNSYYLSPTGSDVTGDGSISKPWFTLTKAWTAISAGDTIYLRGGTYRYSDKQTLRGKNGMAGDMINIWAYPGEKPIISVTTDFNYGYWPKSVILFYGDYFHWKGIDISYAIQRVDGTGGFGMWIQDSDNNIFELLDIHHNTNGIQLYGTCTGNLLLNIDSHHNQDPYSVDTYGGADGISIGYSPLGTSNVMRGCRMWWNSDDGLDLWNNDGALLVDNCWSFYNGYVPDTFNIAGNGVGFKYGKSDDDHGSAVLITTRNSIAYRNKFAGYHQNGAIASLAFYNNIAYRNNNQGFWLGSFDKPHVLTNNVAYANGGNSALTDESLLTTNTFLINNANNPAYSVTDADFISLDESQLLRPRKADGSLPDITFLHLASGSDLINRGTVVPGRTTDGAGKPIVGAPDLGPFETG